MTITFGNWRLRRYDDLNWVLEHWHVAKATGRHKGGGGAKWHSCSRYYQHSGIPTALLYAADWELRNSDPDESISLYEYVERLEASTEDFKNAVLASVSDAGR